MKKIYFLINVFFVTLNFSFAQVTPLTSTTWNQGCFYNESAPSMTGGQCGKAYTGCYATTLAQIFKFHNYPVTSWGGNYTNSGTPIQTVNYDVQSFNYSMMPNSLSVSNPQIANLMYVCGVSNDMAYSITSSDSFFNVLPFVKYFKYSLSAKGVAKFLYATNTDWINAIKNELNNGRVVFAKGGNHFYLIDGYNLSNQFHINFGFGGTYNGYYDILNVVAGGVTYTPTNLIIGIKPLTNIEFLSSNDTNSIDVSATSGTASYKLSSLNNWTISSNQSWCTPSILSGNAGYFGSLTANVSANSGSTARTALLTATDGTNSIIITINQPLNPLSIEDENFESSKIKLFPNPTKDLFYINTNLEDKNLLTGKVYNVIGKSIMTFDLETELTKIDLSKEQSGIYFIELKNNSNLKKNFKIIKE